MIINNVKLVLENEVVSGSLEVQNGEIRAFAESQSRLPEAMDGEGGWLLPGLIELHTDNLDKFFTPRPKVDWPAHSAMSSHDALMVASGITTVLDAVAIGDVRDGGDRLENLEKMINAIEETQKRGVNRAEHRLHLRCELPHHTTLPLFEKLVQREPVTLVSLMDHSPGQRQFANREKYREYYQGKYSLTDAQMQTVLGAVDAAFLRLFDGVDHLLQILQPIAAVAHVANCHGIQYGGDAARHHQRVVAAHRRVGRPVNFRARGEEFIQIIGMQLNQPRQQPAAFAVHRLRQAALAFGKGADFAVLHLQRTAYHLVFQHQLNVIDNHEEAPIGCRRSATSLRTASSWKMPTMAAPRVLASRISSTTAALFLASSEAVGSSSSRMG